MASRCKVEENCGNRISLLRNGCAESRLAVSIIVELTASVLRIDCT